MKSESSLLSLAEQDLENARLLLDHGSYRASITHPYYAMHYGTQALLDVKNIASRSHKGMIQQFGQQFVLSGEFSREMAKNLKEAYDLRQMSDYEANITITQEQAEQALAVSIAFVDRVRTDLSEVVQ
jgi:uncharacterized protein (UPF0332 family)